MSCAQLVEAILEELWCPICRKCTPTELVALPCLHCVCALCWRNYRTFALSGSRHGAGTQLVPFYPDEKCAVCRCIVAEARHRPYRFRVARGAAKTIKCFMRSVESWEKKREPRASQLIGLFEQSIRSSSQHFNVAVVGAAGSGKSTLLWAITGDPALSYCISRQASLRPTTRGWTPHRSAAASTVTWWDSEGIAAWNNRGALRLLRELAACEAAAESRFDLVLVVIRATQKLRKESMRLFLGRLQRQNRRAVLVATNLESLEPDQQRAWKSEMYNLLSSFGDRRERSDRVSSFLMPGCPCLFGIHLGVSIGHATIEPQHAVNELVTCALCTLLLEKEWLRAVEQDRWQRCSNITSSSNIATVIGGAAVMATLLWSTTTRNRSAAVESLPLNWLLESMSDSSIL